MTAAGFEPYGGPIDLSNCEREPIHIPGQIQAHGALWVIDRATRTIVQVSATLADVPGRAPADVLGRPYGALWPDGQLHVLEPLFLPDAVERSPRHVATVDLGRGRLDVIGHVDGPLVLIEVEPAVDAPPPVDFFAFASHVISQLGMAHDKREYCQYLAAAIRDLTGYDRVMIYRFGADWSGEVFAESFEPGRGLTPYLGLHYPASDIPAQARALFLKNTVRMLPDARYRAVREATHTHRQSHQANA